MACLTLGIAVAVALASAIPIFSDAVQLRVLQNRVEVDQDRSRRPPFSFVYAYYGSISGVIEFEDYLEDNDLILNKAPSAIGLPVKRVVRYVHTPKYRLFPADKATQYANTNTQLEWMNIGFVTDIDEHIQIFGEWPRLRDDGGVEALVYSELANEIGVQAGEDYILFKQAQNGDDGVQQKVHVSGIWAEKDADNPYWFYRPNAFGDNLLTTEEIYTQQVAPVLKNDTELGLWYFDVDGSGLDPDRVLPLLGRLGRLDAELKAHRNGLDRRVSPVDALRRYVRATNELTLLLVIFAVPLLAIVLYFNTLVARMVVRQQEAEIAVLRSRGASPWAIGVLYLIEGLIISAVALGLGLLGGLGLGALMTRLTSFLNLSSADALPVHISNQAVRFGVIAAIIGLLAALLPALAASRQTIVAYRTSESRNTRPPLWQRLYLDILLLAVSVYVYFQMRNAGGIVLQTQTEAARSGDPFGDPIRFLAPVLMLTAGALVLLRFFPLTMRGLAALAAKLPARLAINTATLLALRSLARAPGNYIGPLLLLIFTMGLAVFSSSIALTLDRHLADSTYFRVGADMRLNETGEPSKQSSPFGGPATGGSGQNQDTAQPAEEEEPLYFTFVPVQEHLRIPGVRAAARYGSYRAEPQVKNLTDESEFIGVDRVDFQQAAYFRDDFAARPLGALMNQLALAPDALLASRKFLGENQLRVGDPLVLEVDALEGRVPVTFTVAGTFDLFPEDSLKNDKTIFVGNLDYLFESAGSAMPYDVLLAVDPNKTLDEVVDDAGDLGLLVLNGEDSRTIIREAQARPERQGLFGLLSAGFIAASLLTVTGFVLSAIISLRARLIQLGMLRTIGLSAQQMAAFVVLEQVILIVLGAAAGSALGLTVSRLFIPFMQVGGSLANSVPPFVVRIAWQDLMLIYASLAIALVVALAIMLISLRRVKAFEAIKLGSV
jgi:putative ABC transport system permease protein